MGRYETVFCESEELKKFIQDNAKDMDTHEAADTIQSAYMESMALTLAKMADSLEAIRKELAGIKGRK